MVDTLALGASARKCVQVQVLSSVLLNIIEIISLIALTRFSRQVGINSGNFDCISFVSITLHLKVLSSVPYFSNTK